MTTFKRDSEWKTAPSGCRYMQAGLTNALMLAYCAHGPIYLTRGDLVAMLAEFPEPPQYGKDTP